MLAVVTRRACTHLSLSGVNLGPIPEVTGFALGMPQCPAQSLAEASCSRGMRPKLLMLNSVVCSQAVDRERKARKLADKDGIGGLVAHAGSFKLERTERGALGSRSHRQSLFS